jgi:hypothetical protein
LILESIESCREKEEIEEVKRGTGKTTRQMIPTVLEIPLALVNAFLNPPEALMCS